MATVPVSLDIAGAGIGEVWGVEEAEHGGILPAARSSHIGRMEPLRDRDPLPA
jgi:hypothetical protein